MSHNSQFHCQAESLLFGALFLPSPNREAIIGWVNTLPESSWWRCEYRQCDILPLCTENGGTGKRGTSNTGKPHLLKWVQGTSSTVTEYCEEILFPFLGMRTRISLIRTRARCANKIHIDSSRDAFGSRQHKFRIVLQGRSDTLFFVTAKERIFVPRVETPFVMDGSWPHGMQNDTDHDKITLSAGSPWTGLDNYEFLQKPILKVGLELPPIPDSIFEK